MVSILTIAPLRALLVGTSVRFLKHQKLIHSRTVQLKKRIIKVLFHQTAIVSMFYVYPLLLIILAMYFSIAFLPDPILFGTRLLVIPVSMLNSLGQFYVQVRTNTLFRHVLRDNASTVFPRLRSSIRSRERTHTLKSDTSMLNLQVSDSR
ncbi:hypothetical protein PENTCL1PPCAC_21586 [Pristionchus entomophagus]|uniref:G protein-coupled receptor n=1 Tax=Pristionchus entomophagus TaxID=358040 RepID=A0AAV5TYY2_9BILA|nr:hypothetical protein PENTCL1PPCAC_21586 [Pristionchus entomophagus]